MSHRAWSGIGCAAADRLCPGAAGEPVGRCHSLSTDSSVPHRKSVIMSPKRNASFERKIVPRQRPCGSRTAAAPQLLRPGEPVGGVSCARGRDAVRRRGHEGRRLTD